MKEDGGAIECQKKICAAFNIITYRYQNLNCELFLKPLTTESAWLLIKEPTNIWKNRFQMNILTIMKNLSKTKIKNIFFQKKSTVWYQILKILSLTCSS